MSNESTFQPARGLLAKLRQAVFGLPPTPPKYAHPWTAYHPAHFKKDATAVFVADQATATAAIPSIGMADEPSTEDDLVAQAALIEPAKWSNGTVAHLSRAMNDTQPIKLLAGPPELKLIACEEAVEKPVEEEASIRSRTPPEDFMLAARLRSVSVLNRKVAATAASAARRPRAARIARDNRPLKGTPTSKRLSRIEPPAIRLTKHTSAEIIYFRLALARAEVRQARAVKVG